MFQAPRVALMPGEARWELGEGSGRGWAAQHVWSQARPFPGSSFHLRLPQLTALHSGLMCNIINVKPRFWEEESWRPVDG